MCHQICLVFAFLGIQHSNQIDGYNHTLSFLGFIVQNFRALCLCYYIGHAIRQPQCLPTYVYIFRLCVLNNNVQSFSIDFHHRYIFLVSFANSQKCYTENVMHFQMDLLLWQCHSNIIVEFFQVKYCMSRNLIFSLFLPFDLLMAVNDKPIY